jgi:hypothetical protein
MQHVVIHGTLVDGFQLVGPFASKEQALCWTTLQDLFDQSLCLIAPLLPPLDPTGVNVEQYWGS